MLKDKNLFHLIIVGGVIINFFLAPLTAFNTFMVKSIFDAGATGLGFVETMIADGSLIGTFILLKNLIKDKYTMAIFGLSIEGIALIIYGVIVTIEELTLVLPALYERAQNSQNLSH